jgi:diguanylate cyclase (GGDEF)-like protein/PAS domain S-box-containing protein
MGPQLNELSPEALDHIERARSRTHRQAERRELLTELLVGIVFVSAAAVLAVLWPEGRAGWGTALLLVAIYAVLLRISFEIGEGTTSPVQLAFIPMLVLLAPGLIPLAVLAGQLPKTLLKVLRRQAPPQWIVLSIGDAAFCILPALVVGLAGATGGVWTTAAVCLAALLACMASDLAITWVRLRVGLGVDPREELGGLAWLLLVDAGLACIGFLAALAGAAHPPLLLAVLPLGGLLALFAHERRGRIANALELQRSAQESRERLQTIVRNSSDCIMIVGPGGSIEMLTGTVAPLFGAASVVGAPLLDFVHVDDAAQVRAFVAAVAEKPDASLQAEWRMRYADGSFRHVAAAATSLLDDVRVQGIVLTVRDVEDRKTFEEQLRHRAFHDALTGLANRALFYDRVEHALTRGARADTHVGVLFVDLDDFKTVNDTRGHADGDRLLQEVAKRLTACLRAGDTAARLGGDEFGVLVESVTEAGALEATAARVLEALRQPVELANGVIVVSASVGMAMSTISDRGVEEFLRKADLAMYDAKRAGKHRAQLYEPRLEGGALSVGGQWFARDDEQRAEIESVLADPDGITMVFQPIMDLRTGRVAGYESLSRFNREPRRTPDLWFAQAHRHGLGYALEAKAIEAALGWAQTRPAGTYLTFNLSPSSLLSEQVMRVLPPRLDGLVIEITENELVSGDPAIHKALAGLRARGARLAVDDTGAGYAGLTHVMRLQPDIIKLDRALTTGVDLDPAKAPLISSFVRYARDIDAAVCAEGVETLAELERLADLDVAYGQGYGIARPSAPWVPVAPEATAACLHSFQATLSDASAGGEADYDRRLELLSRHLASVRSREELDAWLSLLAVELQADEVRLVGAGVERATQLLADDPEADPAAAAVLRALGFGSCLTLPITRAGVLVGHLEAYARTQRPWSRFQIGRARVIGYQLGALIHELPERARTS